MKKLIGFFALIAMMSGGGALRAQDAVFPAAQIDPSGNISFPGGPTLGTYSHGVFTPSIPAGTVLVKSNAAPAHEYVSGVDSSGNLTFGYVNFSDVVGTATAAQGGSGVASPAAHSLMIAEGSSPYNLLAATTGGRVLLDQGAGVDPAFEVMSGDAAIAANGALTLATTNASPGTYGDATHVAQVTVDAKGRATSVGNIAITHAANDLQASNNLSDVTSVAEAQASLGLSPGTGLASDGTHINLQPAGASAIGGVNSIGAVSHEWIDSISTAGVPHQSQPTFGDIGGTLASTQCPAATTSAQGCVEPDGTSVKIVGGLLVATTGGTGNVVGAGASTVGDLPCLSNTATTSIVDCGFASNAIPTSNILYTASGTGAGTRSQAARNGDFVDAFDYMTSAQIADVQGRACTLDVSTALNAAGTAMGVGKLMLPSGTFCMSAPFVINTGQYLVGEGTDATILKELAGTSTIIIESNNFASLLGTNAVAGPYKFGLFDLAIDGNKANVTGTADVVDLYAYDYLIRNVTIDNAPAQAFFSQWATNGATPVASGGDSMEAHINNFKVSGSGGLAMNFQGPHDSQLSQIILLNNAGGGFYPQTSSTYSADGTQISEFHSYGTSGSSAGIYSTANGLHGSDIEVEYSGGTGLNVGGGYILFSGVDAFDNGNSVTADGIDISGSNSVITNVETRNNTQNGLNLIGTHIIAQAVQSYSNGNVGIVNAGSNDLLIGSYSLSNTGGQYGTAGSGSHFVNNY